MRHLELHIFPWIGALTMEAILPTEVVRCLHRIKERAIWRRPSACAKQCSRRCGRPGFGQELREQSYRWPAAATCPSPRGHYGPAEASASCFGTYVPTTATSSRARSRSFRPCCSSVLVSCSWPTGKMWTSIKHYGGARPRR
ncbi:hypothetical protein [Variovorax paradoxus]|uniref:hypothetical protein n=1 Tax=Variovorax paradoxus TaxID=34073 RepID=UPI0035211883